MRKRSAYKPRPVIANTMALARTNVSRVSSHSGAVTLKIKNYDALEALRTGKATRHDIGVLLNVINMTEALTKVNDKFCQGFSELVTGGQDALLDVCSRGKDSNRFICRASELEAIRNAIELHDAQLELATIKEMEQAFKVVEAVLQSKQAVVI